MDASEMLILKAEITNDPLARGYTIMSDAQVAASLNTADRTSTKLELTLDALVNKVIVWSEVEALSAAKRDTLSMMLRAATLDLNTAGSNARTYLAALFPAGTSTRTNFNGLSVAQQSRATELGLGTVSHENVGEARRG